MKKVSTAVLLECSNRGSFTRTAIFTLGHYGIDISVQYFVTGAALADASLAAMISPLLNGAWFLVLDRIWTYFHHHRVDDSPSE